MRAALIAAMAVSNLRVVRSSVLRVKAAHKISIVITVVGNLWVSATYARKGGMPSAQPVAQTPRSWPWQARSGWTKIVLRANLVHLHSFELDAVQT